jgi:tRNA (guanine26-N2/guanine27-N2)-dimethyltransferase
MALSFPTVIISEGKANFFVPELQNTGEHIDHLRSQAPVFYNEHMRLNRDTAIIALNSYFQKTQNYSACEPMCGTGIRGIRLALETKMNEIVIGDLNPSAIKLAEINIETNKVKKKVSTRLIDANLLLSLHSYPGGRFDYVDIDPYGSPTKYVGTAIRSTKNNGMLALTATDMAPLCGVNPKACLRKYGSVSLQSDFCHEIALRILTGFLVRQAAIYEIEVKPLFSYYSDHYIRLYSKLRRGPKRADKALEKMGYLYYCPNCGIIETRKKFLDNKCNICGEIWKVSGPLWLDSLADKRFCEKMLTEYNKINYLMDRRLCEIVRMVGNEVEFPVGYYIIDKLCSKMGVKSIPTNTFIEKIREKGFKVTRTHYHKRGIKTNVSMKELIEDFNV